MKRGSLHPLLMDLYPLAVAAVSRQRTRVGIGPDAGEDVRDFDVVCSIVRAEAEKGIDWSVTSTLPPALDLELIPDQEVDEMPTPEDREPTGFEIKPDPDETREVELTEEEIEKLRSANAALREEAAREYQEEAPYHHAQPPVVKVGEPKVTVPRAEALKELLTAHEREATAAMQRAAADARQLRENLERQQRLARVTAILSGALSNATHPIHNMDYARQIDWALKMERTLIVRATRPIPNEDVAYVTRREENEGASK